MLVLGLGTSKFRHEAQYFDMDAQTLYYFFHWGAHSTHHHYSCRFVLPQFPPKKATSIDVDDSLVCSFG